MEPLISVIVPVYKVELYLQRCIDSIIHQTYHNLEIILVDDGSPDNCGKICDEYAAKDRRIKAIHKKNGGLSDARNAGINQVTGDYITFVDSDDWVHNRYIEILLDNLLRAKADISACSFVRTSKENVVDTQIEIQSYICFTSEKAIEQTLYQNKLDNSAWGKLYIKSLFDKLRFSIGRLYEDLDIFYKVYERATQFVYTETVLYYYYYRPDSILGVFNRKRLDVLDITDEIVDYMIKHHPHIVPAAKSRKLSANFNMLALMSLYKSNDEFSIRRCWNNICKLRCECLFNPKVRFKNKIGILLSFWGLKALTICFKLFQKK